MTDVPPEQRHALRRMLNRFEVDRAVFFAVSTRAWQLLAGAVTMILVVLFFSPIEQGYYQLFFSLTAAQTFFELGFSIVIVNLSAHEWSRLRLDDGGRPEGDEQALSRLVSLGRLVFKWYAVASLLFAVVVWAGGAAFIRSGASQSVLLPGVPQGDLAWEGPWAVTVLLSGLLLWTLPFRALLEGCGQVAVVQRFVFFQAVATNVIVWIAMSSGAGLWTAVAGTAAQLIVDLILLLVRYRKFFRTFVRRRPRAARMRWNVDIWPMQWRLAVGGVFGYFASFLFVPAMWHAHGPVVAGQMGLTWRLISTVQAAALAWVLVRVPRFGVLIQQQEYRELDRVFLRLTRISLVVIVAGALGVCAVVVAADLWVPRLAERLLHPLPTAIFCAAVVIYQVPQCMAFYVRAHRYEPFLKVNVLGSTAIGLSVWFLGARWGPIGAACGYLAVVTLLIVPAHTRIWQVCRNRLHHAPRTFPSPGRITVVVHSLDGGGAERAAAELARDWSLQDRHVTLLTLDAAGHDRYDPGPRVERIGLGLLRDSGSVLAALQNNRMRLQGLRTAIHASRPDVVVSFTDKTNVLTLLACVGTGLRVLVAERTNPSVHDIGLSWSLLRRLTYPWAEGLVVQTRGARDVCREWMKGRPVYVIPNACPRFDDAVDETHRIAAESQSLPSHRIVSMGRLDPNKGFEQLIDAFSRLVQQYPEWSLQIAGDGPFRAALQERIESHRLENRISLLGWIDQPQHFLSQADIFVLASRYEGFPNVLLEAMACGLPVISFNCPFGPAEIVRHEIDGLLVPAGDIDELIDALERLIADDQIRKKFAGRAAEVVERFSRARYHKLWEAVLTGSPEQVVDAMNDSRDAACAESPES